MIPYTLGIPAAGNNPSLDQPDMKDNNDAVNTILAVDHVSFNTAKGGTHKQITYVAKSSPSTPAGDIAISYTDDGVESSSTSQLYYINSQGNFPLSAVRAFGSFTGVAVAGPVTAITSFNVDSITQVNTSTYTVVLKTDAVNSSDVVALVTVNASNRSMGYSFANPTLSLNSSASVLGDIVNFVIMQI